MKKQDYAKWGGIFGALFAIFEHLVIYFMQIFNISQNNIFMKILLLPYLIFFYIVNFLFGSPSGEGQIGVLLLVTLTFPIVMIILGILIGKWFKNKK